MECAEIWYFDIDNLVSEYNPLKNPELAGENGTKGLKAVYDLQSYWTSMAAILTSLF
jgi:hypothetical protein